MDSSLAWSSGSSISSWNFEARREEGMADLSLGEHGGRKPLPVGISCKLDSL